MGPPLTESPWWCQVVEWSGARRSPSGASTTACHAIRDGMAGTGARALGAVHDISSGRDALQGAPGDEHRQVAGIGSTNNFYKAATLEVATGPIRGSGLQRRVSTATPFAPQGAGHQEGRRESSVDTDQYVASRPRSATGAIRQGLRVESHRHLMRLHFLLDDDGQVAHGVDENERGLWFRS